MKKSLTALSLCAQSNYFQMFFQHQHARLDNWEFIGENLARMGEIVGNFSGYEVVSRKRGKTQQIFMKNSFYIHQQ